jgi:hypothetical protein
MVLNHARKPALLTVADEVIEYAFRNASIDAGEMTLWVMNRRAGQRVSRQLYLS